MSQENVEIVRRAYEGVTARLELPQELFDPDWELDITDVSAEVVGVVRGLEAAEAMRPYWETFEDFHVEIEEVIHDDEEQVVDAVRDGGRIKGSEAEVWNRFFHVWTLRDGKVVRCSIHTDRNRALEAAGLSE
jgi:ketosteroid isomerase-like protein